MKQAITVYSKSSCVHCRRMKEWLKDNQIEYTEMDVADISDPTLLQEINGVPYTIIKHEDGTENVVIGFNVKKLSELLL